MTDGSLGVSEAVSMALGGMIGGGIYAVLGVVTTIAGGATWIAFVMAGIVAACASYSYIGLNRLVADADGTGGGGSVTFVQSFTGNSDLAGMVGWTLLVGYIGSMAMYAFAFGEFAVALPLLPASAAGVPLRPVISVGAVAGFVGLNLLGARATGSVETLLVGAKVLVLVAFGVGGVLYALVTPSISVDLGGSQIASFGPVMAAGVSFVAFQGWQLLFYDQESMADPLEEIPKAIYSSIPVAVAIYVVVAVATYALAPQALQANPHTALTEAASTVAGAVGFATAGGVVLSLSALFSTGSAINATLFSAGYLMSALAFTQRDAEPLTGLWPAIGTVGTSGFFVLLLYHLFRAERGTFYAVVLIAVAVVLVELLYFERAVIEEEIPYIAVGDRAD